MSVTSLKIQGEVRDHLARVAAQEFPGATLSDVVAPLLVEHENSRLRQDISAMSERRLTARNPVGQLTDGELAAVRRFVRLMIDD